MKKNIKKQNKIIPFPHLELRYLEKGKSLLNEGNVKDAVYYLEEAKKMADENEEILTVLTLAYLQQENFSKAKTVLEEMMHLGTEDYFETVELYTTVLFQLHEYKTINTLLTMLLEEEEIPPETRARFEELLELCKNLSNEKMIQQYEEGIDLFEGDFHAIIQKISELNENRIQVYLKEILKYLENPTAHPFIKTVVLHALKENGFNQQVNITKYGKHISINPSTYPAVQDVKFPRLVKKYIEKQLNDHYPSFLDSALTICDNFFFFIYPFEQQMKDPLLWAVAILELVASYLGQNFYENEQFARLVKDVSKEKLDEAKNFIMFVEQDFIQ